METNPICGVNTMDEYSYWFETDSGACLGDVKALSLEDAKERIAFLYPNDVGSDGEITDPNGNTYYLWSE